MIEEAFYTIFKTSDTFIKKIKKVFPVSKNETGSDYYCTMLRQIWVQLFVFSL